MKIGVLSGLLPLSKWSGGSSISHPKGRKPVVLSTWNFGKQANKAAWNVLASNGSALDAVEAGARVPEGNPDIRTVGYGGRPDRDGFVTLDACIMDHNDQCGSVAALQHIKHPISVARKVKEESPHVMLVGEGALDFAVSQGFEKENLLTEESRKDWEEWKKDAEYEPEINIENHDTIGMIALDSAGNVSGACTTSGTAWKMHGRVGDSPLIGSGLFVDNEVGAAAATGLGEEIIRVSGSHLVVENMRRGDSPEMACKRAVERIVSKNDSVEGIQVGFIAVNKEGAYGGYSMQEGFSFAVRNSEEDRLIKAQSWNR
ncbi:MAG: N(4)-(beta-N-acetylglucosaminyl)-L-asparaginase [Fodinibius sp.]|nr:N(4)-(beta-N-acetylglucosaminyl)-L-asparaginase [Fodinibius sp.]MDZ7659595.1 N(4)-(beta-N-acetylglucosaminyl)-L-asparaginase [Fodinibius sp.]